MAAKGGKTGKTGKAGRDERVMQATAVERHTGRCRDKRGFAHQSFSLCSSCLPPPTLLLSLSFASEIKETQRERERETTDEGFRLSSPAEPFMRSHTFMRARRSQQQHQEEEDEMRGEDRRIEGEKKIQMKRLLPCLDSTYSPPFPFIFPTSCSRLSSSCLLCMRCRAKGERKERESVRRRREKKGWKNTLFSLSSSLFPESRLPHLRHPGSHTHAQAKQQQQQMPVRLVGGSSSSSSRGDRLDNHARLSLPPSLLPSFAVSIQGFEGRRARAAAADAARDGSRIIKSKFMHLKRGTKRGGKSARGSSGE